MKFRYSLSKRIAVLLVFCLLHQAIAPTVLSALTSGPSQPEMAGFEPAGTSDMVDLFTGDFKYNIPLFDVEGYPVNLAYQSGSGMDEEASWVGLGWTLNPGAINRDLRGLPDDFKGDVVKRDFSMRDNVTIGLNAGGGVEVVGFPIGGSGSVGLFHNNYRGFGFEFGISPSLSTGQSSKDKTANLGPKASIGINYNSQAGFDISANIGYTKEAKVNTVNNLSVGIGGLNSRQGLKELGLSINATKPTDKGVKSLQLSGGISFGSTTYTPVPDMPLLNEAASLKFTMGGEIAAVHPHGFGRGYYSRQYLATNSLSRPAFGYLNSTAGVKNGNSLMDFNKEQSNVGYTAKMKKLPVAYGTYDLFNATGQGMAAQFRAMRGDVGVFGEVPSNNSSVGFNLGLEFGLGAGTHTGVDVNVPTTNARSGAWVDDNVFKDKAKFTELQAAGLFEPVYFKDAGDKTPVANTNFYTAIGADLPSYVKLKKTGTNVSATNELVQERNLANTGSKIQNTNIQKSGRDKRNQVFSYLSAYEAGMFGLDKNVKSYSRTGSVLPSCSYDNINNRSRLRYPSHHIGEITVTQNGGTRYVYGIPVYNLRQEEVTFSVDKAQGNPVTGLANYVSTGAQPDNSILNTRGRDRYYEAQTLPPYAASYLLTGVLSPDYVDYTGNGISDDDAGSATKFNYWKMDSVYYWRTPVGINQARYNPGRKADDKDDKASYVSGQRELWYMHSIESKNMIVRFYTSDRQDGLGVDKNGIKKGTALDAKLQKLDSIRVYDKTDILLNNNNAVPIKTVYFKYETAQGSALCPGMPNHMITATAEGKLTLTEVYFTYGKNKRGSMNKYKFYYQKSSPGDGTFAYDMMHTDRWGTYKKPKAAYTSIPNLDFPYTYQDTSLTNPYARAWNLNKITLPSGGEITVNYESDDYAYVQDKRAGQHIFVKGFANLPGPTAAINSNLYTAADNGNYYLHLNLPFATTTPAAFKARYLEGVDKLFFNCLVQLTSNPSHQEYIQGYATFSKADIDIGLSVDGKTAVLKLTGVSGDKNVTVNPITKAALQTLRMSLPDLAYNSNPPNPNQPLVKRIRGLLPILQDLGDVISGFDKDRMQLGYSKIVDCPRSWVRLCNPTFQKLGGGSRVSKVEIVDKWANMAGAANDHQDANYGQEYFYTKTEKVNGTDISISSGVASYEPIIGNEENLWREPLSYDDKQLLGPKNYLYQEKPVGEALYPAPSVGYSEVTVRNLARANVKRTATGYSKYKFYTAREFPTIAAYTTLHSERDKNFALAKILKLFAKDNLTMSQGFTVEVNDMHGKPRTEETYNEGGGLIASTEYRYRVDDPYAKTLHLKNDVEVVQPNGSIANGTLGLDVDMWQEMSEENTESKGFGVAAGLDIAFFFFFTIPFPSVLPIFHQEQTRLRTSVTTKFIKRFGILEKVTKMENGSSLTTDNLLFDSETGEVLLTRLQNEFNEPVYRFNYPAHWVYDGIGQTYKNQDAFYSNVTVTAGLISNLPNIGNLLNDGDEVILWRRNFFFIPYQQVYYVNKVGTSYYLLDKDGNLANISYSTNMRLKVKRSVRRNMATASVGTVESLVSPRIGGQISISGTTRVLNAQANTYANTWPIPSKRRVTNCVESMLAGRGDPDSLVARLCATDLYWYTTPNQNTTVCAILGVTPCPYPFLNGQASSATNYNSITPKPTYGLVTLYEAQVGNCILSIWDPIGGIRFKPEDITYSGSPIVLKYNGTTLKYEFNCYTCTDQPCSGTTADVTDKIINPYFVGLKGNWRPYKGFVFDDKGIRNYAAATINQQGYYTTFSPFWTYSGSAWNETPGTVWTRSNTATKYDRSGNELENLDALNRYSAALFAFKNQKPLAVASNSKMNQIGYESFEDSQTSIDDCTGACQENQLPGFTNNNNPVPISKDRAHTGRYSLKVDAIPYAEISIAKDLPTGNLLNQAPDGKRWALGPGGRLGTFQPFASGPVDYIASVWVYTDGLPCDATDANPPQLLVAEDATSMSALPSGPIIDGWRKIEVRITMLNTSTGLRLQLFSSGTAGTITYFDDLRIYPKDSNMRSFAYDPFSHRLMAELDENNYATFYEYDDAGLLVRVKREMEKGVATIKEGRSYLKPN